MNRNDLIALGVAAALVLASAYYLKKKVGGAVVDAANWVNEAAGQTAAAVDTGVSAVGFGVGDMLGVPRTSLSECDRAMIEGRTWDASFACPAATFIRYLGT